MVKRYFILVSMIVLLSLILLPTSKTNAQTLHGGQRIDGVDRYETCVNVSKKGWPLSSDYAVITTGEDFPDALSAAPLAKKYNSPILLTAPNILDPRVEAELSRLKVKYVYIVGGNGAVSQGIQNLLEVKGIKCMRLSGLDRYETSASVAKEIGTTSTVVVTTGEDFPDAVSIAPWAAANGIPILLTDVNTLSPGVLNYLNENAITNTYVIGGPGAVSDPVVSKLKNAKRIQGRDRYATNLAVLNMFGSEFQFNKLYLATGYDFPDSLSGSALASLTKSPIVLADYNPVRDTKIYLNSNMQKLNDVFIIGGQGALPDSAIDELITPVVRSIELIVPNSTVGMKKQVKAETKISMIPSNAKAPDPSYYTGDPSIAYISHDGTITGIIPGKAKITALAGGKSTSLDIVVKLDKAIVLDPGHGGSSTGAAGKLDGVTVYEKDLNLQVSKKIYSKLKAIGADVVMIRMEDSEYSLQNRTKLANLIIADLYLSIHHDSYDETSSGTSAYYSTYKPEIDNQDVYAKAYSNEKVYDADGKLIGNLVEGNEYPVIKEEGGRIYISINGKVGTVTLDDVIVHDKTPSPPAVKSEKLASLLNNKISSLGIRSRGITDDNLAVNRWTKMTSTLIEIGFMSNPNELKVISQDSFQEQAADKIVQGIVEFYKSN